MGIIGWTSHNLCTPVGALISYLAPRVTPGVPPLFSGHSELGRKQVSMPGPQADASQWVPAYPDAATTVCLLCYQEAENLVATVVPTHLAAAVPEVAVYLKEAVGNSTRIDYGTGICC